jgi:hypothetical protein
LAQLLQPALVQHIDKATALQCALFAEASAGSSARSHVSGAGHASVQTQQEQQQQWRQLLAMGVQSTDVQQLVGLIAQLQDQLAYGQQQRMPESIRPPGLVTMLQKHGMWPVHAGAEPADLLAVCLQCSLNNVRPK